MQICGVDQMKHTGIKIMKFFLPEKEFLSLRKIQIYCQPTYVSCLSVLQFLSTILTSPEQQETKLAKSGSKD